MGLRSSHPNRPLTSRQILAAALGCLFAPFWLANASAQSQTLPKSVRQIFSRRCVSCHNDQKLSGGLSLTSVQGFRHGGENGEIVDRDNVNDSYLLTLIGGPDPDMPKTGKPLAEKEVTEIRQWLADGAPWSALEILRPMQAIDKNWWSLRPIERPTIPSMDPGGANRFSNPIDAFVRKKLGEFGLSPAPLAGRGTLIRRLYFDLIGLPPSPDEIRRFVADDREEAYDELVDRLLSSPRYGERWARYWLDVVHYADTHGYDKDKPRENAWPYRDFVIRSFNQDRRWDEFIRMQIAGDALYPEAPDGIIGLGFLAAGPWDLIGHEELPETKIDGQIARHLDRDDMVRTAVQSFCSVTVGCAQCHDHKFDPISQRNYYQLQAVFAAVDRADCPYYDDPELNRRLRELTTKKIDRQTRLNKLESAMAERGGAALTELQKRADRLKQSSGRNPTESFGYHSELSPSEDAVKWVQFEFDKPVRIRRIVLRPAYDDFNHIGAGFGFPRRFSMTIGNSPDASDSEVLLDHSTSDFDNPGLQPLTVEGADRAVRVLRISANKLSRRTENDFNFALAEVELYDESGSNIAAESTITAFDSIEAPPRWQSSNLVDGQFPQPESAEAQQAANELQEFRLAQLDDNERQAWTTCHEELAEIDRQLAELPSPQQVYVAAVHTGTGNFSGTGSHGGRPGSFISSIGAT